MVKFRKGKMKEKILLDTDIGSDIDDAIALAYLLSNPECELAGITTVSGKVEERCMIADVICRKAGKNIPILPGARDPIIIEQRKKDVPQSKALSRFDYTTSYPVGEAIGFMRKTIRENPNQIILLTIGPLTNIALLFKVDPEIPSLLKGLHCMAGWFFNEKRGVEWNIGCDPHAFYIVNKTEITAKYVGLDVTRKAKLHRDRIREEFKKHSLLSAVLEFAEVWFENNEYITFHDIVGACTIFTQDIVDFKKGLVDVEIENKEILGKTYFRKDKNGNRYVAFDINVDKFFEHFFSFFK